MFQWHDWREQPLVSLLWWRYPPGSTNQYAYTLWTSYVVYPGTGSEIGNRSEANQ